MSEPLVDPAPPPSEDHWVGFDLDGTLATHYPSNNGFRGEIGPAVPSIVATVAAYITAGWKVKIFTARVADDPMGEERGKIETWLASIGLPALEITNAKDTHCVEIWDDRAIQVYQNQGTVAFGIIIPHQNY